jgi:hypothetical protein
MADTGKTRLFRPQPAPPDSAGRRFTYGNVSPKAVPWYGISMLWWYFTWMLPNTIHRFRVDRRTSMKLDDPAQLADQVSENFGVAGGGKPIVEALGRDVWIDFIADTGDDVSVSEAVARMVFADHEVSDPDFPEKRLVAPRADIFLFGGDTAYPVATKGAVRDRVVEPFNRALASHDDGKTRILMGIPGNHDWYGDLEGYRHLFLRGEADLQIDGYKVVQSASHFILPLTEKIHLFGIDQNLETLDERQKHFFSDWRQSHQGLMPVVVMHDPMRAFQKANEIGVEAIAAIGLETETRPHLVLSGDIHHYERWSELAGMHVVSGGGGAYLCPAPLDRKDVAGLDAEWPGPVQSRALLQQVPIRLLSGKAGFMTHLTMLGVFISSGLMLAKLGWTDAAALFTAALTGVLVACIFALVARTQYGRRAQTWMVAGFVGLASTFVPVFAASILREELTNNSTVITPRGVTLLLVGLGILLGTWATGFFIATLTRFGYEQMQAYVALMHPGYKHFVRLRVRADGKGIDGWTIGIIDPLGAGEEPVIVDRFSWRPDGKGS